MILFTTLEISGIALLLLASAWAIYSRTLHPLSHVPGPFWPSVTRSWGTYHVWKGNMDVVQRALHQRYGPLVRIAPDEVACADPEAIRTIYRTQAPLTKTAFYPIWNNEKAFGNRSDNFTETDEQLHSNRRRITNNVYSMSMVLTLESYIDKCSDLLLQRLGELADAGATLDLGEWLQWYAFDVIGELFFGRMFGFLQHSHDHEDYIKSLDTMMPVLATAAVSGSVTRFLIFTSAMFSTTTRSALAALDTLANAARACVKHRQEEDANPQSERLGRTDLLHHLLKIVQEKGEKVGYSVRDVEKDAYGALLAGSDTTAIALRAVFYYLMKNPQAYEDLRLEIDNAVISGKLSIQPRYDEAVNFPLLRATIKEAMRLHPSIGLTMPRHVGQSGLELCGTHIPAGWKVGMNAAVVGYDQSIYGPDTDQFRPARWLEGDAASMDRCSLVFGAGTRTCIGKNISLSEIYKLVPLIVRNLDFALVRPESQWKTQNFWFNKQSGLVVRVLKRKH